MKKIVLILCICATCISVKAQEKKNFMQKLADKGFMFSSEVRTGGNFLNLKGKDFTVFDFIHSFGYNFNKYFTIRVPVDGEIALFEKDGVRDWARNGTIGLSLGVIPIRFEKDGSKDLVELYIAAGSTYAHKYDWQYTYYDFGINFADGKVSKFQSGIGIRYYTARKSDNRMTVYVSLGYRFN